MPALQTLLVPQTVPFAAVAPVSVQDAVVQLKVPAWHGFVRWRARASVRRR